MATSLVTTCGPYAADDEACGASPTLREDTLIIDTLDARAPKGAVILFDGTNLAQWVNHAGQPAEWALEHGAMRVVPGMKGIGTVEKFQDHVLHLEFKLSDMPEATGQQKSNSGVFL